MTDDPRALLRRYNLFPRKSLGQNFLVEPTAPARIAALAELTRSDTVIEVGAGLGTLTTALAANAGRVIAVETDPYLVAVLREELAALDNVSIVPWRYSRPRPGGLLGVTASSALPFVEVRLPHYHVVANLPYYITAASRASASKAPVRPRAWS